MGWAPGGVALALALALPEELAEREEILAMTAGVVLISLVLNAMTIGALVRRLGLDRPTRPEQFLAAGARLTGVEAARRRLDDLHLDDPADGRGTGAVRPPPERRSSTVERARRLFVDWERRAVASLDELDRSVGEHAALRHQQADALSRGASGDVLRELSDVGVLLAAVAERAAEDVAEEAESPPT